MISIRLGKLEVDLGKLDKFIAKAKKHCYAGEGEKQILPDGSKRLIFQEGDFWYEDDYDGREQAPGRELVKWQRENGQRIWQMAYCGGMRKSFGGDREFAKEVFKFLREALMQVPVDKPFRGPEIYIKPPFVYHNDVIEDTGNTNRFLGTERIFKNMDKYQKSPDFRCVFDQDYIGGLVIP